jgi:hypothetical protein
MWTLLLITLINGGEQTRFETRVYQTEEQCIINQRRYETPNTYGYCELVKKDSDVHHHFSPR